MCKVTNTALPGNLCRKPIVSNESEQFEMCEEIFWFSCSLSLRQVNILYTLNTFHMNQW